MHSTSSSSSASVSVSSLVQYVFLAAVVYVLAGAPLSTIFGESSASKGISVYSNVGADSKKLENLVVPEADLQCGDHAYKGVYILSRDPLVVYIEGFLSGEEAKHVVDARYVHHTKKQNLKQ
jgi:prolyl 4-hydroxylase